MPHLRCLEVKDTISLYFNAAGELHAAVNSTDYGPAFTVPAHKDLYVVVDVSAKTRQISIVDTPSAIGEPISETPVLPWEKILALFICIYSYV